MKLKQAHVTHFRSILDSGPVEIGATTCLVGKNESGKTAFLKALEGLNPADGSYTYDRTRDYPRRHLTDYNDRHNGGEATIISTVWELEDDDREALADEFGDRAVTGSEITKNTRAPGPEAAQIPKSRRIRINSQQSF